LSAASLSVKVRGNTRPLFDWDLNRRCDPDADHEYKLSRMSPFIFS
jgi:hypothetical protein